MGKVGFLQAGKAGQDDLGLAAVERDHGIAADRVGVVEGRGGVVADEVDLVAAFGKVGNDVETARCGFVELEHV